MIDGIIELVLDESKWLAGAMLLSVVAVVASFLRRREKRSSRRLEILRAMNLFYACTIGVMATGHLLAVTVKTAQGTLEGSSWILYPLGLVLAVPAWWLAFRVGGYVQDEPRWRRRTVALNGSLGIGLLALGLHNLPLAVPAALNIGYQLHSRRAVGWAIVAVALAGNLLLFIGSLVFLASGQSFEQFQGIE